MNTVLAAHGRGEVPAWAGAMNAVSALGQAVASASGSSAERVARTLSLCCESFAGSIWPEIAWRFSGLTTDGSPLEFTFSSVDNLLRYTVDVAPPEIQNHERIAAACDLAGRLGHSRPAAAAIQPWLSMQQSQELSWGASLGVRDSGSQESVKFYLEIPLQAQQTIRSFINPPLPDSLVVMIGYEPRSGRTEYYFRQRQLSRAQLGRLLGTLGSDEERATMLAGIEHVCGMPLTSALQWTCFGYSLALEPREQTSPKLALFVKCRAVGGPVRARRRMLQCMLPAVKERSLYHKLCADLPAGQLPDHGVVSVSCAQPDLFEMRIGLSGIALSNLLQPAAPGIREPVSPSCLSR